MKPIGSVTTISASKACSETGLQPGEPGSAIGLNGADPEAAAAMRALELAALIRVQTRLASSATRLENNWVENPETGRLMLRRQAVLTISEEEAADRLRQLKTMMARTTLEQAEALLRLISETFPAKRNAGTSSAAYWIMILTQESIGPVLAAFDDYARDPSSEFAPSPGKLLVRIETMSGLYANRIRMLECALTGASIDMKPSETASERRINEQKRALLTGDGGSE